MRACYVKLEKEGTVAQSAIHTLSSRLFAVSLLLQGCCCFRGQYDDDSHPHESFGSQHKFFVSCKDASVTDLAGTMTLRGTPTSLSTSFHRSGVCCNGEAGRQDVSPKLPTARNRAGRNDHKHD